jgi:Septin
MPACTSLGLQGIRNFSFLFSIFQALTYFYFGSLKPLDIEIMKRLGTRVNLIPVIAKADTLTQNDLFLFKKRVR